MKPNQTLLIFLFLLSVIIYLFGFLFSYDYLSSEVKKLNQHISAKRYKIINQILAIFGK